MSSAAEQKQPLRWYQGITRYQWLVLVIASLGWIFDVFEGQIFVTAGMQNAMPQLLRREMEQEAAAGTASDVEQSLSGLVAFYNNIAFGAFLVGGALGGVIFGLLSDRIGRTRTMVITILIYSCFTCVTALAQNWWQMVLLRFIVALGVGGEWAVASAMVAEVFPQRARAWSGAIFHGSSVLGTYLAIAAGVFIVGGLGWRWAFAVGALPAFLVLWIRWQLREPDRWIQAKRMQQPSDKARLAELTEPKLLHHVILGVSLAAVGLATFWGVHIYGKDPMRANYQDHLTRSLSPALHGNASFYQGLLQGNEQGILAAMPQEWSAAQKQAALERVIAQYRQDRNQRTFPATSASADEQQTAAALKQIAQTTKNWEMLGIFLTTTGGGLGLLCFGPLCEWLGRRGAFLFYHLGALIISLLLFLVLYDASVWILSFLLPVFGFLTLGMHAGYAIYFPELFPTRLRGTGGGFCFNVGRVVAAPILFLSGWMQKDLNYSLPEAAALLSGLFVIGIVLLAFAPETKGQELPD